MNLVAEVEDKISSGIYRLESVPCFCGSFDSQLVTDKDRYGLTASVRSCLACGLMYTSPRMDAESYRQFYQHEYRAIYRTGDDDPKFPLANGRRLWTLCDRHNLHTKVVVDIGCGTGGMLSVFANHGSECYGIDHDAESVAKGQALGYPVENATIDDLVARGIRADLIVMHHSFEHCLDLRETLSGIRKLLRPDGVLYIGVPGVLSTPVSQIYQNAHTYYFTARTLERVMECCGWSPIMLDEYILSMWVLNDRKD